MSSFLDDFSYDYSRESEGNVEEVADELFNGPSNVSKNGVAIPVLYGELIVGGAAIAAEFFLVDKDETIARREIKPSVQDSFVRLS